MNSCVLGSVICILYITCFLAPANAQTDRRPNRMMKEDDLILFNVAVKGRVVELLANEIARTEIIRALLYEYAKECVQNITLLEKSCLKCMTERCQNRLAECEIKSVRLSEIISHDPSPIEGLQFLSHAPKRVTADLIDFADNARADILRDVPEKLRGRGEKIVHSEVDQSLSDLKENMDTEKTLQTITIHFQKVANNVHLLPELGEKLATLIVENGDRAVNIAELLASKLRDSRPYLESMQHNGEKIKQQTPGLITQMGNRLSAFKNKVVGIFNSALDTFDQVLNNPDTPVTQEVFSPGNQQQLFSNMNMGPGSGAQQFPVQWNNQMPNGIIIAGGQVSRGRFQSDFGPIAQRQSFLQNPNEARRLLRKLELQVQNQLEGLQSNQQQAWVSGGTPMNRQFFQQNPQIQNRLPVVPGQGPLQGIQGPNPPGVSGQVQQQSGQDQVQGQLPNMQMRQNIAQNPSQFPQNPPPMPRLPTPVSLQNQPGPLPLTPQRNPPVGMGLNQANLQSAQNQQAGIQPTQQGQIANPRIIPDQNAIKNPQGQPVQVQPTAQGQQIGRMTQGQLAGQGQGRQRRQAKPDCDKLRYDPETYCKSYESQCHNCTLEKRLRFEVCGEGVEKARDEIKRLDKSVQNYLEAYDDHIAYGPLVLKVELNDTNRLAKTNTYYDAYITAKIGSSIFRYKTKMNLNVNDLRISGSQIGDEIWEKLWEEKVFEEQKRLEVINNDHSDMGQLHKFDVKIDSKKTQAHKSSAGTTSMTITSIMAGVASAVVLCL